MVTSRTLRLADHLLYVDRRIVVVNKPPGLVCQTSARVGAKDPFAQLMRDIQGRLGQDHHLYPVHRLDKPTTGALVLARDIAAARELSSQFKARQVGKTYLELVRGGAESFGSPAGEINTPLHVDDGRVSLSSESEGITAVTGWEVLASSPKAPVSLLKLQLYTGNKHQIRAHLAEYLKAPILGDTLFSRSKPAAAIGRATPIPDGRLFLHSYELSFIRYSKTRLKKRFQLGIFAPLPPDFQKVCADLSIHVGTNEREGGVSIDGVHMDEEDLSKEVSDLQARWRPVRI